MTQIEKKSEEEVTRLHISSFVSVVKEMNVVSVRLRQPNKRTIQQILGSNAACQETSNHGSERQE